AQNTTNLTLKCTIANTTVQVTNPLAFPELRLNDPAGLIPITISNPGPNPVMIMSVALSGAPQNLTLAAPSPSVPTSLAVGNTITTMLTLSTLEDIDLTNVTLNVVVI